MRKPTIETLSEALEEVASPGVPECPPHLDEEARAEWDRIVPLLGQAGILERIDRAALAAYCQSWSRLVEAETKLKETGLVVRTPQGFAQASPYLSIARGAMKDIRQFLSDFGLSPASRLRLLDDLNLMPGEE